MDSPVTLVSLIAILGAPLVSLPIVSSSMVRLALLLFLLYSIQVSELSGLLALLAIVSLVSERNYMTITGIQTHARIPVKKNYLLEPPADHPDHPQTFVSEEIYKDSNPRLAAAPTGARSAEFYMAKKLSV